MLSIKKKTFRGPDLFASLYNGKGRDVAKLAVSNAPIVDSGWKWHPKLRCVLTGYIRVYAFSMRRLKTDQTGRTLGLICVFAGLK